MGKATLARQKAIGAIGVARVQRLDDAGLTVIDTADYERMKADIADLRRQLKVLLLSADARQDAAAQILAAAMEAR